MNTELYKLLLAENRLEEELDLRIGANHIGKRPIARTIELTIAVGPAVDNHASRSAEINTRYKKSPGIVVLRPPIRWTIFLAVKL